MTGYVGRPYLAVAEAEVRSTLLDTLPTVQSIEDDVTYYIRGVDHQVVVEAAAVVACWVHVPLGANLLHPKP
jgi:hypothetical protein